jgi:hypothetical protein
LRKILIAVWMLLLTGCSSLIQSATDDFASNLSTSILNHPDPKTIEQALPTYLVLLDSFIEQSPNDASLLRQGASLYAAYAGMFVKEKPRRIHLTERALEYGGRALCAHRADTCGITAMPYAQAAALIKTMAQEDMPYFYALGESWAGWIQAHAGDWNAVAQLAQVKLIMQRIVAIDENFALGGGHVYLGILNSLVPPAMGGKPALAREHFERAIAIAQQRDLMPKVAFARYYARLVYDQALHDRLLREVLAAKPEVPGYTLVNTLAQLQARELLASGKDYF